MTQNLWSKCYFPGIALQVNQISLFDISQNFYVNFAVTKLLQNKQCAEKNLITNPTQLVHFKVKLAHIVTSLTHY